MIWQQILYRAQQFRRALSDAPAAADLEAARRILSAEQMALFLRLQPSEQAHSLRVFQHLQTALTGETSAEGKSLLIAALLHDVGKTRYPLNVWDRVVVVMGKAAFPGLVANWGKQLPGEQSGDHPASIPWVWRRAFVVAQQHPEWGAEMAAEAGASPLAVNLIRRHQNHLDGRTVSLEEQFLQQLQSIDQTS